MVVTIVIPLHNSEKDLPSLINFLDQQTFRDFSLLFVDDYSSDQTVFALERILSGSPLPFRILKKEQNGGAGKARDYAIDSGLITTKYVIFLDPDDEPLPSFLELLVAKADATNADITMCGFERKSKVDGHIIATEMVNNPETITELESCPIIPFLNPLTV
jgi:glycosyltransferase involved in cell wall biosynthesis